MTGRTSPGTSLARAGRCRSGASWPSWCRRPGPIAPVYQPTRSPAVMRFLRRRGFDHDCLPAALLSLAVKGRVVIADGPGDGFTVERRAQAARTVAPSPDEAALLASLFDEGQHRFEVPTTRSVAAERMVARHRRLFDDAALRRHVRLNTGWWGGGVAFLAAWGLRMALLIPALVFIVVVAFGALILGGIAVAGLGVAVQRVRDGGLGALGETVFSGLAGLAFGAVSAGLMVFVGVEGDWRGLVLVAAGVALPPCSTGCCRR
ncbi:MAG: DUF2207 family protein [Acetobacteraceae bacterium]